MRVDKDWRHTLLHQVAPFISSAENMGAIASSYFTLTYQGHLYLELYLQAEAAAVHTVLRPALQERFGRPGLPSDITPSQATRILHRDGQHLTVSRACQLHALPDALLQHHAASSKLYLSHTQLVQPSVSTCLEEVDLALANVELPAATTDTSALVQFAKARYQTWITNYLSNRYTHRQYEERLSQEVEVTAFLATRRMNPTIGFATAQRKKWIAATRELAAQAPEHLPFALQQHVARYALEPFEVGMLWYNLFQQTLASDQQRKQQHIKSALA